MNLTRPRIRHVGRQQPGRPDHPRPVKPVKAENRLKHLRPYHALRRIDELANNTGSAGF